MMTVKYVTSVKYNGMNIVVGAVSTVIPKLTLDRKRMSKTVDAMTDNVKALPDISEDVFAADIAKFFEGL